MRVRRVVDFGLLVLLASGCGAEKTGTIFGKVLYRGQPLSGGFVDFVSEHGKVVTGRIDPDGTYVVSGMPVGPAKITVRDLSGALDGMSKNEARVKIPLRYRSADDSGLRHGVTSGRQERDLELQE